MINFKREGTVITAQVNSHLPIDLPVFLFQYRAGSEHEAYLVREKLSYQYAKAIEIARQEAYEQGYADGRAKRARKTWFQSWLE